MRLHSLFSDEPLLGRDLEHSVQLQPGGGKLLFGGPVVALPLPLPPRHHQEDEQAHQGNKGHSADDGPHNQGQLFASGRLKIFEGLSY